MPKTTATQNNGKDSEASSKSHFTKAMEEARAGAQALGKETLGKADKYREKLQQTGEDLAGQARTKTGQAKEKAEGLANEGKAKASQAISSLGKLVEQQGDTIDDALSGEYGDYARRAGKSIQNAATRLDEKSFGEMGDDAKEFVRKSPALAVGMAAAAGFLLARMFSRK